MRKEGEEKRNWGGTVQEKGEGGTGKEDYSLVEGAKRRGRRRGRVWYIP